MFCVLLFDLVVFLILLFLADTYYSLIYQLPNWCLTNLPFFFNKTSDDASGCLARAGCEACIPDGDVMVMNAGEMCPFSFVAPFPATGLALWACS